ncbi:MAG TPA: hypothetical protein VEU51_13415 [Candidatus Acidoferrales bacterium]|nr:hypothetical protein [Candidatus Acidoferrales bacterium]
MSPIGIGFIVLACVFGGAMLGMVLHTILPEHHLSTESKDVIKLAMGVTATMSALVLALLVASAKSSYDAQKSEITKMSANAVVLDRLLAHYGPETKDAREVVREAVNRMIGQIWPSESNRPAQSDPTTAGGEILLDKIQGLSPQNDAQRSLQAQALRIAIDIGQTRWLLIEQSGSSIPMPFLVLLIFWVTIIFISFGLYAPRNATVIGALLLCALSVSGAIYLILELDRPFEGLIQISSAPLHNAAAHLGK